MTPIRRPTLPHLPTSYVSFTWFSHDSKMTNHFLLPGAEGAFAAKIMQVDGEQAKLVTRNGGFKKKNLKDETSSFSHPVAHTPRTA